MKNIVIVVLFFYSAGQANAQNWKVAIESGFNMARLIPTANSTPAKGSLHYGYKRPGIYLAPELQLRLTDHLDAGLGYQYTNIAIGTEHRTNANHNRITDKIDMHNMALSLRTHYSVFNNKLNVGAFAKVGFAYSSLAGMSTGGGAGGIPEGNGPVVVSSGMSRTDNFDIMPGSWIPNTTLGISLGPNCPGLGDRLTFNWAATLGWRNLYDKPASYDYYITYSNNTQESGTVRYQGKPFILQFGMSYRLFGFGKKQ